MRPGVGQCRRQGAGGGAGSSRLAVSQAAHAPPRSTAGWWPEQQASVLGSGGLGSEMEVRAGSGSAEASLLAVPRPLRRPSRSQTARARVWLPPCADGGPAGHACPGDLGRALAA